MGRKIQTNKPFKSNVLKIRKQHFTIQLSNALNDYQVVANAAMLIMLSDDDIADACDPDASSFEYRLC